MGEQAKMMLAVLVGSLIGFLVALPLIPVVYEWASR